MNYLWYVAVPTRMATRVSAVGRAVASAVRSSASRLDRRGAVPLRIAPLLILGLILVVLAVVGAVTL